MLEHARHHRRNGVDHGRPIWRANGLWITEAGDAAYEEVMTLALENQRKVTDGLSDADIAALISSLDRIISNLKAMQ